MENNRPRVKESRLYIRHVGRHISAAAAASSSSSSACQWSRCSNLPPFFLFSLTGSNGRIKGEGTSFLMGMGWLLGCLQFKEGLGRGRLSRRFFLSPALTRACTERTVSTLLHSSLWGLGISRSCCPSYAWQKYYSFLSFPRTFLTIQQGQMHNMYISGDRMIFRKKKKNLARMINGFLAILALAWRPLPLFFLSHSDTRKRSLFPFPFSSLLSVILLFLLFLLLPALHTHSPTNWPLRTKIVWATKKCKNTFKAANTHWCKTKKICSKACLRFSAVRTHWRQTFKNFFQIPKQFAQKIKRENRSLLWHILHRAK